MSDRLESRILSCLRDRSDKECLFWQGSWFEGSHLLNLIDKNVDILKSSGFSRGDRLALLLPNCPALLAVSVAAWSLGGTIVPLNMRAGSDVLSPTLDMIDPFMTVYSEDDDKAHDFLINLDSTSISLNGALSICKCNVESEKSDAEIAVIFTTSGTTGLPKAVPLTHLNITDNIDRSCEVLDFEPSDRLLWVLPNFHSFGLTLGGLLPLVRGLKQVIVPLFMPPGDTLKAIKDSEASVLFLVPTMVEFLKRSIKHGNPKPSSVKKIVTGGDRLNLELDKASIEFLGVPILEGYGTTECSPVVAVNRNYESRRLGTIGQILPGYEWEVRDSEGKALPAGQDGILWVKGNSVFEGYYKAPEVTAEKFCGDWYNTGDVVRYDEDGFITVLDRVTDIIIIGGFNVYPQEVERVVASHPSVASVAVVAMDHPVQGQIARAFVVLNEGENVTQREIISFCKGKLAHYKIPRRVDFVESLPTSPSGKVLRRKLRDMSL